MSLNLASRKSDVKKQGHVINLNEDFCQIYGFYHVLVSKIPKYKFHVCVDISSFMNGNDSVHFRK